MEKDNSLLKTSMGNIGKDILLYIPGQLVPSLLGFISLSIYTRIFSAKDYGEYSLIITTLSVLSIFGYSWLSSSNLRFFSMYRDSNRLDSFFTTSSFILILSLITSLIAFCTLSMLSFFPHIISNNILILVGYLLVMSFYDTFINLLRADRKPRIISIIHILSSISHLLTSLFLIYVLNFGISALIVGYIISYLIFSVVIILKLNFYKHIHSKNLSMGIAKELSSYGLPLIATLLFSWVLIMFDRYIIFYFRGNYEVGIYSAAYQLASYPLSLISSIIIVAAFPVIIGSWEKHGEYVTRDIIADSARYYLLFATPAFFGITTLSKEFIQILDQSYSTGYNVLPWICFGSLVSGFCFYTNKGLELHKKTRILSYMVCIVGILNIVMNLFLVPKYGYYGAGVATCLSYIGYLIISHTISKKYLKLTVSIKSVSNLLISSFVMSFVLLTIKQLLDGSFIALSALIVLGVMVYFSVLAIIGELENEIFIIKAYLRKESYN